MKTEVIVVGLGGVGSWIVNYLDEAGVSMKIFDSDVVEEKNIPYTTFTEADIGERKAHVLVERHDNVEKYEICRLVPQNIGKYYKGELVVLCVDSLKARKNIIERVLDWIDCRAEDEDYQIFTHNSDLIGDFLRGPSPEEEGSCQSNPEEEIYEGNVECAKKAKELVLDFLDGNELPGEVFS